MDDTNENDIDFQGLKHFLKGIGFEEIGKSGTALMLKHQESDTIVALTIPENGYSVRPRICFPSSSGSNAKALRTRKHSNAFVLANCRSHRKQVASTCRPVASEQLDLESLADVLQCGPTLRVGVASRTHDAERRATLDFY